MSASILTGAQIVAAHHFRRDAADELYDALNGLLELVEVHGLEPCGDFDRHEFDAIVDGAVIDARKALAKARGEA